MAPKSFKMSAKKICIEEYPNTLSVSSKMGNFHRKFQGMNLMILDLTLP